MGEGGGGLLLFIIPLSLEDRPGGMGHVFVKGGGRREFPSLVFVTPRSACLNLRGMPSHVSVSFLYYFFPWAPSAGVVLQGALFFLGVEKQSSTPTTLDRFHRANLHPGVLYSPGGWET